jgi:hypothetical protein
LLPGRSVQNGLRSEKFFSLLGASKQERDVPYCTLLIMFGNTGLQIFVPCRTDARRSQYSFFPVPIATFANANLIMGPPQYTVEEMSSIDLVDAPSEASFHIDVWQRVPSQHAGDAGAGDSVAALPQDLKK